MRRIRYRIVLPIIFAFLAVLLFLWDYQNDRVAQSMGMAWDTGPPVWPYRAVPLLSYALNAPAYIISWPILNILNLQTLWLQYVVWFPVIVLLWWWVGAYIDFGLLGRRSQLHRWSKTAILITASVILLLLAARSCLVEYRWIRDYWKDHPPVYAFLFLRTIGETLWCLFLATALIRAAIQIVRRKAPTTPNPYGYRAYLLCTLLVTVNISGIAYVDHIQNPPRDPNSCIVDRLRRLGCVHGEVLEEGDKPVTHVEVDLIRVVKTEKIARFPTKSDWTDEQGRYNFDLTGPGEYVLAVNPFETSPGPSERTPFETRYYREADDEAAAESVTVIQPSATNLPPLQLRRAKFTSIEVKVKWEDGSRPKRSDLFVQNTRYWGLLAGFEDVENGVGKVPLAHHFQYVANASVECIRGEAFEQRVSRPSEQFTVADGQTPRELILVLPGPVCALRDPR